MTNREASGKEAAVADRAETLLALFQAGVDAVGGRQATQRSVQQLNLADKIHLVAVGKAADAMATGAITALGDRLVSGLVITKYGHTSDQLQRDTRLTTLESAHPVPDQASLDAGRQLGDFVASVPANHQLLFLVSGGTSSLVEDLEEGLSLSDLKQQTDRLLASGAAIGEMNRHRRTLSRIKGGKLARRVSCPVIQLLISDVPGDKPGDIGSGLLVPDSTTGMGQELAIWDSISTQIIASSAIAQAAVAAEANKRGMTVVQPGGNLDGDMPEVIDRVAGVLAQPDVQKGIYIWGGEPTVVLPESPGRGGRNQHLSLALAGRVSMHEPGERAVSVLVCGTDGTDGPTGDAGGLINEETTRRAKNAGLDIDSYLAAADAGSCLEKLDALVTTGPTGTNVMDLAIAIVT